MTLATRFWITSVCPENPPPSGVGSVNAVSGEMRDRWSLQDYATIAIFVLMLLFFST